MHWASRLSADRAVTDDVSWLGPDADRIRSAWGPGAIAWAARVGEDIIARGGEELPLLGGSGSVVDALRRATISGTLRALAIVSGCAEPGMTMLSPEGRQSSRDLARRGLTMAELTRTLRFGHSVLASALIDAITATTPPADVRAELLRVSQLLFTTMDQFISDMTEVFADEQVAWTASRTAARLEAVRRIVEGDLTGVGDAESVLEYPFAGEHVGVIVWSSGAGRTAHELHEVVDPVLRCWGTPRATLVVPVGSNTVWAWGTFSSSASRPPQSTLPVFDTARVVTGQVAHGLEGFRRSHLEARSVERLVRHGSDRVPLSVAHEDVDLDALLLADRRAAARFVDRHLGPLAGDDRRMRELRTTLLLYLEMRNSLTKVAAAEHISRNTVTYRVQQAFTLCGHSSDRPTTALHAALLAARWLTEPTGPGPGAGAPDQHVPAAATG